MEVRVGCKQTEVGVLPEGWDVEVVGAAFEICNQLRLPISQSTRKRMAGPYPYYGPTNVQGWINEYRVEGEHALIGEDGDHFLKWRDQPMTLLVTGKFNVNNHAHIVRGTKNLTAWFYWFFANRDISNCLTRQGAGRYKLTKAALLQLPCALPPLPEQRAIAAALSDVDALLGGLDGLIAKKRDLKQAAMQQLLTGQTRLPGFHGEWKDERLGSIAEMGSGGTPLSSVAAYYDGDIPWVSISDMTKAGKVITTTERNLTTFGFANCAAQMFPAGTVLYAMYASLGECSIAGIPLCTSQAILGIRPKSALHPEFLYYALTSLKRTVKNLGQQGTQPNLSKGMVQDFRLRLPSRPEQVAIAGVLADIDVELAALEARRDKTRALKQAMMQELLTGRTRLVAPSSNVVAVDFTGNLKPAPTTAPASKSHNWQINEAVVLAVLVNRFGSEQYPLGRMRRTKLAYLLHRHAEHVAEGYKKKAAGPYNSNVKFRGPEGIAQKNGYVRAHRSGSLSGFVAAERIAEAEDYFAKWYGNDLLAWLEQFRFQSNDELELLTTVDMAVEDLIRANARVDVEAIKAVIRDHPEWQTKLERAVFSDANIAGALSRTRELFPTVDPS